MKRLFTLLLAGMFALGLSAQSTSQDEQSGVAKKATVDNITVKPPVTWTYGSGKNGLLYDNGTIVNIPGAPGFADTSRLQSVSLSMTTLGAGVQISSSADNRLADDFDITDSTWVIDSIAVFLYQTNSPITSTITELNMRIWDGSPDLATSNIVWGDDATNILATSYWSNIYRDSESATGIGLTNRPVMRTVANTAGLHLPPGMYWVDFQAAGSLTSGPWGPPITITGQTITGNSLQYTSSTTTWAAFNDGGTLTQQGVPFLIFGYKTDTQGMDDLASQKTVKVYPNPATSHVNVKSTETISRVEIFNQVGQLVLSQEGNTNLVQVNTSQLQGGIYAISIHTGSNVLTQKLLVK